MEWLQFFLIGGVVGLLAGVFGVGGGSVMVPVLMLIFAAKGFPQDTIAHLAIGTSFAVIIFTSLGSVWGHQRKANIHWLLWRYLAVPMAIGVTVGSWFSSQMSSRYLELLIGLFFALIALQMVFKWVPEGIASEPSKSRSMAAGLGIGGVSAFIGIGGGSLTVPWLRYCAIPVHRTIGTSAACGLPIAVFGALSYWWFGRVVEPDLFGNTGFIYLPALMGIVLTSVPTAMLGAKIGRFFPEQLLIRCFALMLFCVGTYILLRGLFQLGFV